MTAHPDSHPDHLPEDLAFLAGGGEATQLILARDWGHHPLGPPVHWPAELKTALSLVLNSPESMILAWGQDDLSFFFNDTYFPLLGPRLPWAMGAPFKAVWADAWDQAKPIIDDAFAGNSRRFNDLPWKLATDRGEENTWWTFSYSRILDACGEAAGLFIFTNETTARVLADSALRDSEEQLRHVVEGARDYAIVATDPDGVITRWSTGAEHVMGWTAAEAVGQPASLTFTPEDRAAGADRQELDRARRDGSANDERWHLRKNGTRVFMNGSIHPLPRDAEGRERGFIKVARDETDRWKAQQALKTLNSSLEQQVAERTADRDQAWRLSRELLSIVLPDGTFEAVNPLWTELLGWAPADLVGTEFAGYVHPDEVDATLRVFAGVFERPLRQAYEYRFRHKDGTYRWFAWTAAFEGGKIYASGRHTTLEREQARQLVQAQKMEAVGQLTGGLAHDFNNLLAGITGALDLIKLRMGQGRLDDLGRFMDVAQGAARRAASLTHRLLAFSRQQTLDPRPTDVNALIAGMEELIRRTIGPQVELEVVGAMGLWPTQIDPGQLENALLNLCINARDAMPDGGRITIETANKWLDHFGADRYAIPEGQYLSLCVTDNGTGMTPDIMARVFEPFFTTKPIGEGTGLGLSMIHGFASQSGGQVRIYSEPGEGTTVCMYLPRHYGDVDPADAAPQASDAGRPGQGETVLVVDDEPSVRMLVTAVLEDLGYRALEAADSAAGLKLLQSDARIDLLITDVGLPGGMNGRQMADAGRYRRPDLKVLFITGYAENSLIGNGHLLPGMHVMTKPFAIEALAVRIKEMIEAA